MSKDDRPRPLEYKTHINRELEGIFASLPDMLDVDLSVHAGSGLDKLQEYTMRSSKRVRGCLAAFAYDYATDRRFARPGITAGAVLELAQSYLLIVDDVMDKSELRRGRPSMHQLYRKEQSDAHTADMMAINVGLVAQHLFNVVLAEVSEDSAKLQHAFRLLHKNLALTGFGQLDDLAQQIDSEVGQAEIIRKYILKSSYYTFINPLQFGLALGGESSQLIHKEVEEFGAAAGVAFQMHDDLLGIFGEATKLGKSNVDDLEEGKCTLLMQHALFHASPEDRITLESALGSSNVTKDVLLKVQEILEKTGSKSFVKEQVVVYVDRARSVLESSTFWDDEAQQALADLLTYAVSRES